MATQQRRQISAQRLRWHDGRRSSASSNSRAVAKELAEGRANMLSRESIIDETHTPDDKEHARDRA